MTTAAKPAHPRARDDREPALLDDGFQLFASNADELAEAEILTEDAIVASAEKPSSRILGNALEEAGMVRPAQSAAHHIVAGKADAAGRAREVLQRFGISINEAANGVFLPAYETSLNPLGAAIHSTLHMNNYYATVNNILIRSMSANDARAALEAIRNALLSGETYR